MFAGSLARYANQLTMRFVQCAHRRHENTAFRTRLRSYIRDGCQNFHRAALSKSAQCANVILESKELLTCFWRARWIGRATPCAPFSADRSGVQKTARPTTQKSKMKPPVII